LTDIEGRPNQAEVSTPRLRLYVILLNDQRRKYEKK